MRDRRLSGFLVIPVLLCPLFVGVFSATADCRPGRFSLEEINEMPTKQLMQVLHDKTGCNFIFSKDYRTKKHSLPEGKYQPVELMTRLAKQLNAQLSFARTVLVIAPQKLTLIGTGKLVSVDLVDAPIESVNQIIRKLGSGSVMVEGTGGKISASLYDVPLDDLVGLLELFRETNG